VLVLGMCCHTEVFPWMRRGKMDLPRGKTDPGGSVLPRPHSADSNQNNYTTAYYRSRRSRVSDGRITAL